MLLIGQHLLDKKYDIVILDAPPVLPVNDAVALSEIVDLRAMIVGCASTPRTKIKSAMGRIAPSNLILSAIILSKMKYHSRRGYHLYRP